ncbi:MAG: MBOAT family protein [Ruminococcaceae bacterium]|nr:MBOAT family protein [Oscillospiraceae bacterium]
MLFSSISFLFYFLAGLLAVYFILPFKIKVFKKKSGEYCYFEAKNFVLLIASLLFYFYGEPIYTILMVATVLVNYIAGLLIDKFRGTVGAKIALWASVIFSLGSLGFFKYSDFFITNINAVFRSEIKLLMIALPIGISFYTFQILSYTIDVYRGQAKVQKSFIRLATYVSLFPQLIAGPIVRYTTVEEELSERKHTFENFSYGVTRFVIGLSKKVLIADTLGGLSRALMASDDKSVAMYWLYAIAITIQLYFDFSGYSDMAIGLGRIFGFEFLENFNYPFISKRVAEFWRRWHMSLGSWFRDYVYIPLGGNRVSKLRWVFNTLAVWFLTGFWHGADWTFIFWGLMFAALLMMEKFFLDKLLSKIPAVFAHIYVIFMILISFVLFHANGMSGAIADIGSMFGAGGLPLWSKETGYYLSSYAFVLIFGIVGSTPIVKRTVLKIKEHKTGKLVIDILEPIFDIVMLLVVTAYFVDGSFSPFLYFRF